MSSSLWISVVMVTAGAWIVWQLLRSRDTLRIVVDRRGLRKHEGVAGIRERELIDFFERHVSVDRRVVICGIRQPNGGLRLRFRGSIDWGTRQQIRNFLTNIL